MLILSFELNILNHVNFCFDIICTREIERVRELCLTTGKQIETSNHFFYNEIRIVRKSFDLIFYLSKMGNKFYKFKSFIHQNFSFCYDLKFSLLKSN